MLPSQVIEPEIKYHTSVDVYYEHHKLHQNFTFVFCREGQLVEVHLSFPESVWNFDNFYKRIFIIVMPKIHLRRYLLACHKWNYGKLNFFC